MSRANSIGVAAAGGNLEIHILFGSGRRADGDTGQQGQAEQSPSARRAGVAREQAGDRFSRLHGLPAL